MDKPTQSEDEGNDEITSWYRLESLVKVPSLYERLLEIDSDRAAKERLETTIHKTVERIYGDKIKPEGIIIFRGNRALFIDRDGNIIIQNPKDSTNPLKKENRPPEQIKRYYTTEVHQLIELTKTPHEGEIEFDLTVEPEPFFRPPPPYST